MTDVDTLFVLVHSPIVGPLTWSRVGDELRRRGVRAVLPTLHDVPSATSSFWEQHAACVARALSGQPESTPLILVAHSGAGPLLPAIRQSLRNPVRAYVFVDAGIPQDGATRLELMQSEDPQWAQQFREELEQGARFPTWSFDDLKEVIPDDALRRQMVTELQPRGLDFFTEPIPVFEGWPDAPCVYIQFSTVYDHPAAQARQAGWPTYRMQAGHFHMLVDPESVAETIVTAINALR